MAKFFHEIATCCKTIYWNGTILTNGQKKNFSQLL